MPLQRSASRLFIVWPGKIDLPNLFVTIFLTVSLDLVILGLRGLSFLSRTNSSMSMPLVNSADSMVISAPMSWPGFKNFFFMASFSLDCFGVSTSFLLALDLSSLSPISSSLLAWDRFSLVFTKKYFKNAAFRFFIIS